MCAHLSANSSALPGSISSLSSIQVVLSTYSTHPASSPYIATITGATDATQGRDGGDGLGCPPGLGLRTGSMSYHRRHEYYKAEGAGDRRDERPGPRNGLRPGCCGS